jgi:CRP/FNR family transcriptional regulator
MDFTDASAPEGRTGPADAATGASGPGCAQAPSWQQCAGCAVRSVCLPAGMSAAELESLGTVVMGHRKVRKGQLLYREGERFLFLYAVRAGSFKASVMLKDGTEQVTSCYLRGEVMGLDGAAGGVHANSVRALEDSEVCAAPYAQLSEAAAGLKALHLRMMQMAGAELLRERHLLTLVANTHAEARVAAFLLQLSERMRARGYLAGDPILNLTRSDLGSYLATTQETVSRCITSFARRGLITVRKRRIRLADPDKLQRTFAADLPR